MTFNLNFALSAINRIPTDVERLWRRPRSAASAIVFFSLLLAMVVCRCSVALYGDRYYASDAFMVLDGAWRMLNGQRPHVDFSSMIGPGAYAPTVIGFVLAGNTVAGFGYGQAMVTLVLGIWAYCLGSRLCAVPRTIYALCVAAIAVSPSQMGLSSFALTPAVSYNRYTYAMLGVLLLECLSTEVASEFVAGFSTGALISILAFTKITGFIVGAALVIVLVSQRTQTARRWLGFAAGSLSTGACFLYYLRFDLLAVFHDLAFTVLVKKVRFTEIYLFNSIALDAGIALLLALGASLILIESGNPKGAGRELVAGLSVTVASLLLIFGNYQQAELPLLSLYFVMAGQRIYADRRTPKTGERAMSSFVIGVAALFAGVTVLSAVASLSIAQWIKLHSARVAEHFDSPALAQFVPAKGEGNYPALINDGFALYRQHSNPGDRVMTLDYVNPFSYGLWIPPAPGGAAIIQYDANFNERYHLSPEKLFGAADVVMMTQQCEDHICEVYGPFLQTHFQLVAESSYWKFYRRRSADAK